MLKKILMVAFAVCSLAVAVASDEASAHLMTVSGKADSCPAGYVPPVIGNGNLNLLVDYQGCQFQHDYAHMRPTIWWAGRRYGPPRDQLIPFGRFTQELTCNGQSCKPPSSWTQTLDTRNALIRCQCDYADMLSVETTVFVPLSHDMVVVKKRVSSRNPSVRSARLEFKYQFSPPGGKEQLPKRTVLTPEWNAATSSLDVRYQVDGYRLYDGIVSMVADKPVVSHIQNQSFSLTAELALDGTTAAEITFYLLFADSMDGKDYLERSAQLKGLVKTEGYAGLLDTHQRQWGDFWAESYVHIPAPRLEQAYNTAMYHLRVNATPWSFPVGIFDTHWAGRYFGWDEMFCFLGLASSNHLTVSKRVPEFRHAVLEKALKRTAHYSLPQSYGARYPWETLEDGEEGAPPGFWIDHVFHMSNIAVSAWFQYLYNGDLNYLNSTGYPVIKECATFYAKQMIYDSPNGGLVFGKCTDLERLGSARLNPFMTSCGAIFTLETARKAAAILKVDAEQAAGWQRMADKLKESLPQDGKAFVPYAGCQDASIAVLGGIFPYPVFGPDNALQKNAVYGFVQNGIRFGNMYPVGKSVCAWYAGWMATALVAYGDKSEPARLLQQAADGTGCFSETFEINEEKVIMHPWFSTAEGNVVYALNQMLLFSQEDQIRVAASVPEDWKEFAFKLPCYGNLLATVTAKSGRITELILTPGDTGTVQKRTVIIPERLIDESLLNKSVITSMTTRDGCRWLELQFKGVTTLVGISK